MPGAGAVHLIKIASRLTIMKAQKGPEQCHLWRADTLVSEDLRGALEAIEQYVVESHFAQCLLRCRQCGQLYFYTFQEEINWEDGDDPQYSTYVPVETSEEAKGLRRLNPLNLSAVMPRLQKDFPTGAKVPKVYWVGK